MTLEAHELEQGRHVSQGLPLDAASPLARELTQLISRTPNVAAVADVAKSDEVLYRMHVPAKVASQVGRGLAKPMSSKAVEGGIHGDIVTSVGKRVVKAKATFVPVPPASAGAAGAAAGTAAAGTAVAVAAPLILMAVAVSASAYADRQRQQAIDNITDLLEKLHSDRLDDERSELEGCQDAIEKATALLLDRGRVGASLGLDSAVHAISTATQTAERRVKKWEAALDGMKARVEVADLEKAFPGVTSNGGEFRAHVELAALAIALKRRVVVLQGVEAGQGDPGNPFEGFLLSLQEDQRRVDRLQSRVEEVLRRLASLEVRSPKRLIDKVMTRKQVDDLLETSYRLRALDPGRSETSESAVIIDIERRKDGTLLVLPAAEA
ncbi:MULTISPECIES: hypothetical protein [unclassified Aeromicrobium]|uniref:hypothetical protein n=1 Tax=unclassified Aeromicrobium TaxID=2633570 RepID=UPI00288B1BE3|nr:MULTISPECIES: hypothetical protein [unclassified Aeromicrobium]